MRESFAIRVRALAEPLLPRLLGLLAGGRLPAAFQRLGALALDRVAARFPVMAELLGLRGPAASAGAQPVQPPAAAAASPASVLETALATLANDPSWSARASAAQALADAAVPNAVDALLRALRDPSVEVATAAIDALARKRDARVVPALRMVLENA